MSTQLAVALVSAIVGGTSAIMVALITGYVARSGKTVDRQAVHETALVNVENALRGDLLRRLQVLEDRDREKSDRIDSLLDTVRGLKDELTVAQQSVKQLTAELAAARDRVAALLADLARLSSVPQES